MSFIEAFPKHFYYDRINKDDIVINDIAVSFQISVALQDIFHTSTVSPNMRCFAASWCRRNLLFEALMHDATEAYCRDIPHH